MKKPQEISAWDLPDRIQVPDGYDMKSIPDLTRANLEYMIDEHNNLVECFNALSEHIGFEISGE